MLSVSSNRQWNIDWKGLYRQFNVWKTLEYIYIKLTAPLKFKLVVELHLYQWSARFFFTQLSCFVALHTDLLTFLFYYCTKYIAFKNCYYATAGRDAAPYPEQRDHHTQTLNIWDFAPVHSARDRFSIAVIRERPTSDEWNTQKTSSKVLVGGKIAFRLILIYFISIWSWYGAFGPHLHQFRMICFFFL